VGVNQTMAKNADDAIIIVGAGHIGLTLALALAQAGFSVWLLDEKPYRPRDTFEPYDYRVSAITPASVSIFQQLNVWEAIANCRVAPFQKIEVWQENSDKPLSFAASEVHQPQLGFIIENSVMQNALFLAMSNQPNIHYIVPSNLEKFDINDSGVEVILANGQHLSASLLIGADGASSRVRSLGKFSLQEKEYGQVALVATVQTSLAHRYIARQRFLVSGPLAFLPLSDLHYCSIVWSHQPALAQELALMPEVEFNTALQDAFGSHLGEVRVVSERKTFPLIKRHVKNYVQPRVALIGDAAHTIHPMAGQGMNLGLQDAIMLADILVAAKKQQRDIGLLHTLRRYERAQKTTNQMMLSAIDAIHYLFREQTSPITLLRDVGLQLTARCLPLKKMIMRRAMGLG
jgi:2-octaprenylphenol hydroxylase